MRLVVLQPSYLPWLGYFDQMRRADVFVYLDDVQYDRGGWRNRNRIRTTQGWQWLTVPVFLKGRFGSLLMDVEIDNRRNWSRKHLQALQQSYTAAAYTKEYLPRIEAFLTRPWSNLVELNIGLVGELGAVIGLKTETLRSSELRIYGSASERLIAICNKLGATEYLTGDAARSYLDESLFARAGIRVEYQHYKHPTYPQLHGEFMPLLSIVDLVFNCGPESLRVLKGDNP